MKKSHYFSQHRHRTLANFPLYKFLTAVELKSWCAYESGELLLAEQIFP